MSPPIDSPPIDSVPVDSAAEKPCACCSGRRYEACCKPLHQGVPANSPEALMRSRFAAFKLGLTDYLQRSWSAASRPATLDLSDAPEWVSLQVLSASTQGDRGQVHFRAIYRLDGHWGFLEEVSDFIHETPHWFYLAGKTREGALKPGRNDPCPCGSGKKFKACCS